MKSQFLTNYGQEMNVLALNALRMAIKFSESTLEGYEPKISNGSGAEMVGVFQDLLTQVGLNLIQA